MDGWMEWSAASTAPHPPRPYEMRKAGSWVYLILISVNSLYVEDESRCEELNFIVQKQIVSRPGRAGGGASPTERRVLYPV